MTSEEEPNAKQPDSKEKVTAKRIGWGLFAVFGSGLALWLILPTLAVLFILLAFTSRSCVRSCTAPRAFIPPIHGLVVDAATGQGLQGARVMRVFYHEATAEFDTTSPYRIKDSLVSVVTDTNGRFTLPGTETLAPRGVRGLSGMAWVVWKSGWMPAFDCYFEDDWAPDRCSPFGGMQDLDPWVETSFQSGGGEFRMEVRIFPPTQREVKSKDHDAAGRVILHDRTFLGPDRKPEILDPWAEYFRRLDHLVQYQYLTVEEFVKEAEQYARSYDLTESIYNAIYALQQSLGGMNEAGRYDRPDQALILLGIQDEYCKRHVSESRCASDYLEHRRSFLQQALLLNQKAAK